MESIPLLMRDRNDLMYVSATFYESITFVSYLFFFFVLFLLGLQFLRDMHDFFKNLLK
jgi:hypothetical protein